MFEAMDLSQSERPSMSGKVDQVRNLVLFKTLLLKLLEKNRFFCKPVFCDIRMGLCLTPKKTGLKPVWCFWVTIGPNPDSESPWQRKPLEKRISSFGDK